ncbi:M64 family metallopeptidase [Parabacteroides pacaensis]|uniref:M64 family metallopeptidase n=1 Tax=Parabacteroides pacaensis TaxID=2086575 RepID=UPI000D0EBCDA|nr:M64 family metallopeptidase [Parabacteroides pacaensis]
MKKLLFSFFLFCVTTAVFAQFDTWFYPKTMRMDYFRCGDGNGEEIYLDEIIEEPYWGGSTVTLVDQTGYGNYFVKIYDAASNQLLYSKGYNVLFGEWQATEEAKNTRRCYTESVVFPYPRKNVKVVLETRNRQGTFEKRFEYKIDVNSYFIKREHKNYQTFDIVYSGNPAKKVDIVLLPEGYTPDQYEQFKDDCQKFADAIFTFSPYKENKHHFNVRGVWSPSVDAGVDIPGDYTWKETVLNSNFYTFDSERYLMTADYKSVRNLAASVPYDLIYIIANTKKYGGGAIYNYYGISSIGQEDSYEKVYVHEFGHLFLGLADEYEGDTSYNDLYPKDIEPWEPNITNLIDFDKKWKHMLPAGVPVPTPVEGKYAGGLGVFEGGGYCTKGMYRPAKTCLMRTFYQTDSFCPVCKEAILKQINLYTK